MVGAEIDDINGRMSNDEFILTRFTKSPGLEARRSTVALHSRIASLPATLGAPKAIAAPVAQFCSNTPAAISVSASDSEMNPTAPDPKAISVETDSGCTAAYRAAMEPPSDIPNRHAIVEPAAAITALMSSMRWSMVGAPTIRSDIPVPRLSKRITRENDARRPMNLRTDDSSQ